MDCFEFRRVYLADSSASSVELRRHHAECPHCKVFVQREDDFERILRSAIQVDVPADLQTRLLLRQAPSRRRAWNGALAYAAAVLLLVGTLFAITGPPRSVPVGELVVSHILAEPEHLLSTNNVGFPQVAGVLTSVGLTVRGELDAVRFAERCPGWPGAHLVLAGYKGPVSVLIMPTERVNMRQALYHGALTGVLIPMREGVLAIVGLPGEPLAEHERRLRAAILEV